MFDSPIKFRVWDSQEKTFVPSCLIADNGDLFIQNGDKLTYLSDLNRFKILRNTGLKDSGGIDIYEGDILQGYNWDSTKFLIEVKYIINSCGFNIGSHITEFGESKIVGNIYKNPDLIK